MEQKKTKKLVPGPICGDCAKEFNLVWPKGHVATFWTGVCAQCQKESSCCSTGDYNHRNGKKVLGGRD